MSEKENQVINKIFEVEGNLFFCNDFSDILKDLCFLNDVSVVVEKSGILFVSLKVRLRGRKSSIDGVLREMNNFTWQRKGSVHFA
ncbi:MAG TPA: hypothetical protein P5056_02555 [Candidatus Paceibacterota bacterium]|nr:hypothetical protein [Candidatus Paceibacterota bacterium]